MKSAKVTIRKFKQERVPPNTPIGAEAGPQSSLLMKSESGQGKPTPVIKMITGN